MTLYEKLQDLSLEKMAEFLLGFANDTIDNFTYFRTPDIDKIREMLRTELDH